MLMRVCVCVCEWQQYGRSTEDNIWELVLSFHHVGPRNQIQVFILGRKSPYFLSHLRGPQMEFSISHV